MAGSRERAECLGLIRIQFERLLKRATELDVLLGDNPVSLPAIYGVAREVMGHAAEMMRLSGSLARAEILLKWKAEQEEASDTSQTRE